MRSHPETRVTQVFNRLTDLPTLPAVVDKLLQLSDQEASFKEFGDLIATDPGLTAKVLKLVNSAFYSLKAPVSDLAHACSMIGVRTIKSLVLSVSVMQLFKKRCHGFEAPQFWRHSLACALVSRKVSVALKFQPDLVEEAYISGLLHACGVPLFVQFFPDEYSEVLENAEMGEDLIELELESFGAGHPEAGGQIVTHWRLSPRISETVRLHRHTPDALPADLEFVNRQLIDLVGLADLWTRRVGIPFLEVVAVPPEQRLVVPEWMGFEEEELAELIGDVEKAVSETEQLFRD